MGIQPVKALEDWFSQQLRPLRCSPESRAYVAGVLRAQAHPRRDEDLSGQSVVLALNAAMVIGDFAQLQRVGDWVLWAETFVPQSIDARDAFDACGQRAYLSCHRIMRGQWAVYEELAVDLRRIVAQTRLLLA